MLFICMVINECISVRSQNSVRRKSEIYQAEQLDKIGMEVIPVDLRDAYAFGGGLHCSTADVYREGNCRDYFPNQ